MKNNLLLLALFFGYIFNVNAQEVSHWVAPEYTKSLKNPITDKDDIEYSIEGGRYFFSRYCTACHGKKGLGNGKKAENLTPRPANLTELRVQNQADGEIFWKIEHGRNKMLSFKKIMSEEDRWFLVNYIRTLVK